MRYPEFFPPLGKLGFVAPSFGCATEPYRTAFNSAQNYFASLGIRLELGPNVYMAKGIGISNTPEKCAEELNNLYCSETCQALISAGGGEMMCEILPYLNFDRMRKAAAKWYMGYSDNTNFTYLSAILLDTAAIYGPCASDFGMQPWHPALRDAWNLLKGLLDTVSNYDGWERSETSGRDEGHPLAPYHITEPFILRRFEPDEGSRGIHEVTGAAAMEMLSMEGRLLGGCVDCLINLLGTRFDKTRAFLNRYSEDGIIWFLECCDLNPISIRRAMWQMRESGWFDTAKGFLIGRALRGGTCFGTDQYTAVTDILGPLGVPILMDLDIGHLSPMMPVICGSTAAVLVRGNHFSMKYTFR